MKQFLCFLSCFLLGSWLYAQGTQLSGKITDKDGNGILGITVYEKGTNNGTYSDENGQYSLSYKDNNSIIVFSGIGYAEVELKPDGQTTLDVQMKEEVLSISGVEIVGTRNLNRTATETPVAIEIIPISQVTNSVGQLDLNQVLQFVAPSFNSNRQSGSDGTDHIDPATLRGLGPDQTLVLINGKRRHQSSLVNIYGTRGRGNTGTDLNAIPAAAIERIEILRDGAAAQYGSDAIAGVINIVLKNSTGETSVNLNTGAFRNPDGGFDGENVNVNGNTGFKIGENGYFNVTLDFMRRGRTVRPAIGADYIDGDKVVRDSTVYRRNFGDAQLDNFNAFFNAAVPIGGGAEVYAFGGYNVRLGDAYAWTRDVESDRNIKEIYPNGFDPHILSNVSDKSLSVGVRGKVGNWTADFNNTFGDNNFHYYVNKSLNASMGVNSPTRFDAGGFGQTQNTSNLSFTRFYDKVLSGLSIAAGSEFRVDNYRLFAGEEASWQNYGLIYSIDSLFDDQGLYTGLDTTYRPGGAQGFPGFRPSNEVNESRTNIAAYLDVELDITRRLTLAAATRFERYSDFGSAPTAKLAMRYAFTPKFALRASFNSGFRAPSLAQINFNSVYTNVVGGKIQDQFLAKNNSPVTRALGIPALKQERSTGISVGFTAKPLEGLSLTVDGYLVDVKDRIVLTGIFSPDTTTSWGRSLLMMNVSGAQFFTNALDTRTMGLDVIATYTRLVGPGRLALSFAANLNKMELSKIKTNEQLKGYESSYFGVRDSAFLIASAPPSKYVLTADYKLKRWNVNLRFNRFGKVTLVDWKPTYLSADELKLNSPFDVYKPKITTDLALGYDLTGKSTFTVGASNLFNVYPDKQDVDTETGGNYDPVQMGFGGTFIFARWRWKF